MNRYLTTTLIFGLILALPPVFPRPVFAASAFNIAVIQDCQAGSKPELLKDVKAEILSLTKGEFDVRFPAQMNIVSDCREDRIKSDIARLADNAGVNMILSLGPLSSHIMGQLKKFPKPCIAGFVLNPELQSIPYQNNRSGKSNFTYVSLSPDFKGNVGRFRELTPFKTAAFLYDDSISSSVTMEKFFLNKLKADTGIHLITIPVGSDPAPVLDRLKPPVDAVFLGHLVQLDKIGLSQLIAGINEKKLPSFSFHDRQMVEQGLLAGFDRSANFKKLSRRIAILVQRILLDENPKDFKVGFSGQEQFLINMETARGLNLSPRFSLMAKAELINHDPFASLQSPGVVDAQTKAPRESLVSTDTRRLNADAFNLNETQTSLTLKDAVAWALEHNLVLKSRARQTAAGKMNVKDALSRFYPQLGTTLGWAAIDDEHASAISGVAERSWDISARVGQLLYSYEAATNLETSRRRQIIQELSEHQEKLDVILETGIAYLSLLKARAGAKIQLDNLNLVRSNLVLANNRYKAGFSGPSDVYRLESEAFIAHSNFLSALADVGKARIRLNQILNINQEEKTSIKDIHLDDGIFIISDPKLRAVMKIDNPKDFRRFMDFMTHKGLAASPEIKSIDERIRIQENAYDLARRSFWSPNVSLNGIVGNTISKSGEGSELDTSAFPGTLSSVIKEPDDTRWTVSLTVDLPFYEGGAKSAAKIRAIETKSQLTFLKADTQNRISENIRSALYDTSASYQAIELTELSAEAAGKNLELVQDAYSKGALSIINLLDAQNAALVANTSADNAVYDFFIDYLIMERASGSYTLFLDKDERDAWVQDFQK